MLNEHELFNGDNLLKLTKSMCFENTSILPGARYTPNDWCSDGASYRDFAIMEYKPSYFSGYVFRGAPEGSLAILEAGFMLMPSTRTREDLVKVITGAKGGQTYNEGISTSICASGCTKYTRKGGIANLFYNGYVYLIDATCFQGYAIPCPFPNHPVVQQYPALREIYDVNFPNMIPNFTIVGIVWPVGKKDIKGEWPDFPRELNLAVNPYYLDAGGNKGMEAALKVVNIFNLSGS